MKITNKSSVNNIPKIDPITKTNKATNDTLSSNFALNSDYFYSKLQNKKKDNIKFKKPPKKITYKKQNKKNIVLAKEDKDIILAIRNFVSKYNESILYLKKSTKYINDYPITKISKLIINYKDILKLTGIYLNNENYLLFNEEILKSNLDKNKKEIYSIFDLDNGFIKKVLDEISSLIHI
jgi:flagellar capping protein FliD